MSCTEGPSARWRRRDSRFIAGSGPVAGYAVHGDEDRADHAASLGMLDTEGLWGAS